jgi:predicted nucleic acid-binding protein
MTDAVVDTGVLLDYLAGDERAQGAIAPCVHRAISVVTWLELMAVCPAAQLDAARGFLRTFERLSISESVADEALRLVQLHPGLPLNRALTWATARVNQLGFITTDRTCAARGLPLAY